MEKLTCKEIQSHCVEMFWKVFSKNLNGSVYRVKFLSVE